MRGPFQVHKVLGNQVSEGGEGGFWGPKVCAPKEARSDCLTSALSPQHSRALLRAALSGASESTAARICFVLHGAPPPLQTSRHDAQQLLLCSGA